jgi:copper chaperone CopZ
MEYLKSFFKNKTILMLILIILAVTTALAFGNILSKNTTSPKTVTGGSEINTVQDAPMADNDLSKVILSVNGMSCSGCISTIKSSLTDFSGIRDIVVDIRSSRAEVYFDAGTLKDVSKISEAITAAGYPANVQRIVSPGELKKERDVASAKSQYYIASVGGWDIARADFDTELEIAKGKYSKVYGANLFASARGVALLTQLQSQIISRLLDEGIIMQEIQKAGFKVDTETVKEELEEFVGKMGKSPEEFRESLNEIGYDFNYFNKKFEIKVLINKYINDRILADASNPSEKQNMFTAWFNNSKLLAEVVYYDKDLEKLIRNQSASSGCGS